MTQRDNIRLVYSAPREEDTECKEAYFRFAEKKAGAWRDIVRLEHELKRIQYELDLARVNLELYDECMRRCAQEGVPGGGME